MIPYFYIVSTTSPELNEETIHWKKFGGGGGGRLNWVPALLRMLLNEVRPRNQSSGRSVGLQNGINENTGKAEQLQINCWFRLVS